MGANKLLEMCFVILISSFNLKVSDSLHQNNKLMHYTVDCDCNSVVLHFASPAIDLHSHASSLSWHAAAKSGDPLVPGDDTPQREKDSHQQSS